ENASKNWNNRHWKKEENTMREKGKEAKILLKTGNTRWIEQGNILMNLWKMRKKSHTRSRVGKHIRKHRIRKHHIERDIRKHNTKIQNTEIQNQKLYSG